MKTRTKIIGSFIGLASLAAAFAAIFTVASASKLDHSSKAYVDKAVRAITANWSSTELRSRAAAELLEAARPEALDALFVRFRKVGNLVQYDGASGEAFLGFSFSRGRTITADYVASATFENGRARIRMKLVRRRAEWQILQFYVDAPGIH